MALSDGTSVQIPAGALSAVTAITITPDPSAPPPDGGIWVGTPYLFGPEGTQFASPVTVTLPYVSSELPADAGPDGITIDTAPAGSTDYVELVTTVVNTTLVAAETTHFSVFGCAYGSGHVYECSPSCSGVDSTCCLNGCTDVETDNSNCGECDHECAATCLNGQCCNMAGNRCTGFTYSCCPGLTCGSDGVCVQQSGCGTCSSPSSTCCGTTCVDTLTDANNCGGCAGAGGIACDPNGEICCNGSCISSETTSDCGSCGNVCSGQTPVCNNGTCVAANAVLCGLPTDGCVACCYYEPSASPPLDCSELVDCSASLAAIATIEIDGTVYVIVGDYVTGGIEVYSLSPSSPPTLNLVDSSTGAQVFSLWATGDPHLYAVENPDGGFGTPELLYQYAIGDGGTLTPLSPAFVPNSIGGAPQADPTSSYLYSMQDGVIQQLAIGAGGLLSPLVPPTVTMPGIAGVFQSSIAVTASSLYAGGSGLDAGVTVPFLAQFTIQPGGTLAPQTPATVPVPYSVDGITVAALAGGTYVYVMGTDSMNNDWLMQLSVSAGALVPGTVAPLSTCGGLTVADTANNLLYHACPQTGQLLVFDIAADGGLTPASWSPFTGVGGFGSMSLVHLQ